MEDEGEVRQGLSWERESEGKKKDKQASKKKKGGEEEEEN